MSSSGKRKARDFDAGGAPSGPSSRPAFVPSAAFAGARDGYFFRLGDSGPGYYVDALAPSRPSASSSASDAAARSMPPPPPRLVVDREEDAATLLARAEAAAANEPGDASSSEPMEEKTLRKLVLVFERRYAANQEARLKHPDRPEKFVDSEVDLDDSIRRLRALAGYPELYPEFCRLKAIHSVLGLFAHENPDVAAAAIELVRELTDAENSVDDESEGGEALVAEAFAASLVHVLVQTLDRFGGEASPEETAAVNDALGIVENAVEIRGERAAEELCAAEDGQLPRWLLKRVRRKKPKAASESKSSPEPDPCGTYAAELLAILAQSSDAAKLAIGRDAGGVDALLRAVAPYKSVDPANEEESEKLENLFDALCAVASAPECAASFVACEGLELMLLMMRSKSSGAKTSRAAALKCVDHALTRNPAACARFVDAAGLGSAFGAFMGRAARSGRRGAALAAKEEEERSVSVLASLFENLEPGERRNRLCAKFVEDEYAKCDRLAELWGTFDGAARRAERDVLATTLREPEEALDADEAYVELLGRGMFALERVSLIFGNLWATGHAGIRDRLRLAMGDRGAEGGGGGGGDALRRAREVLERYAEMIGDAEGEEEQMRRKMKVVKLLVAMGGGREEAEAEEEAEGAEEEA